MSTIIRSGYALDVSTTSLSEVADIIRYLDQPLKQLKVTTRALQSPTEMRNCLRTVSDRCSQLESLRLTIKRQGQAEEMSWFDLSPILLCSRIKKLEIKHPCVLPIVDDDIFTMLSSWENIEQLSLNAEPTDHSGQMPGLTLRSLAYVAQMGPNVREARFCLDLASSLPVSLSYSWSSLSILHLGTSIVNAQTDVDLLNIAEFVNEVFPTAQLLTARREHYHVELEELLDLVRGRAATA
ncbi:hypothetical protein NEOLEDRAFT_1127903 [Neolentinus lepideus HHB14362 ss-1]|uniref:F-box domain-containing protein n=1 Tax=Neolentinus lepideus HHB14362 ss-1 TaxID=1314782 RepID=A0A165V6K5_9AGAM|nr:hypothetical protein NEOLEDRAFT_1127903 [Neolentinus lepideus HHB14362 ss-1]